MIRMPVWPGLTITFGGRPNPQSVEVKLWRAPDARTVRLVSKRGWMLLLVRYDWREATGQKATVKPLRKPLADEQ